MKNKKIDKVTVLLVIINIILLTFLFSKSRLSGELFHNKVKVRWDTDCEACRLAATDEDITNLIDSYGSKLDNITITFTDDLSEHTVRKIEYGTIAFQQNYNIYILPLDDSGLYDRVRVLDHEIGHALYFQLPYLKRLALDKAFSQYDKDYVTEYAKSSVKEDIAETWSMVNYYGRDSWCQNENILAKKDLLDMYFAEVN